VKVHLEVGAAAVSSTDCMPPEPVLDHDTCSHQGQQSSRCAAPLKAMKPQPQFLRIRWEDTSEQGGVVTLEAILCLQHRQEIALTYASARGSGGLGKACDLCEGRNPRSFGALPIRPQSARVP
jgi:hypothetical protein